MPRIFDDPDVDLQLDDLFGALRQFERSAEQAVLTRDDTIAARQAMAEIMQKVAALHGKRRASKSETERLYLDHLCRDTEEIAQGAMKKIEARLAALQPIAHRKRRAE
jgi:hypothetical protein